jgi:2-polyprenyl-6-methoxyphenol hydroxylase-like FAD-dependent oxidoreductase
VAVVQDESGATVTLRDAAERDTAGRDAAGSTQTVRARYVVGADGYHSTVRQAAGIGFSAGTYAQTFILADLHMDWPLSPDEMRVFFAPDGMLLVVPFAGDRFRIVATVDDAKPQPALDDVQALLDRRVPGTRPGRVHDMTWSSRFHIHHGVADHYRAGRVFLAGDAAHVHSPAGGQGMNTGIQDAVVLGDRLAAVIAGQQADASLDRYEADRRPVAQQVVAETDRLTKVGTLTGVVGQRLRAIGLQMVGHVPALQRKIATRIAELEK